MHLLSEFAWFYTNIKNKRLVSEVSQYSSEGDQDISFIYSSNSDIPICKHFPDIWQSSFITPPLIFHQS